MAGSLNDTYTENPFSLIPTWSPPWPDLTWPPYMTGPLEYSELPTIMSTREPENSLFKNISLAVRVVLFIVCLIENSIAIYILCKIIKNGREVFSRSILINMACADISTTVLLYPVEFVNFHQFFTFGLLKAISVMYCVSCTPLFFIYLAGFLLSAWWL